MPTPTIKKIASPLSPWEVFQSLYSPEKTAYFLDSHSLGFNQTYSYMGVDPFLELILDGNKLKLKGEKTAAYPAADLFPVLRELFAKYKTPKNKYSFFQGGAVGYWGYELADQFESVRFRKKSGSKLPKLHLGFYRDTLVYDHGKKVYYIVGKGKNPHPARQNSWRVALSQRERGKRSITSPLGRGRCDAQHHPGEGKINPQMTKAKFKTMIRRAKDYIAEGDIYQANLSQRFDFDYKGDPLKLYDALRTINPSPFSSFLNFKDFKIISSSPERLVQKKGRFCETRPIAGTRRRNGRSSERELLASEKERAEHIMLVDLERNDLGRVCDYKSVRVEDMMGLEKYSHVIHIASKITGQLSKGKDRFDLIRTMFPGGTITGCPKVRCMEIIDELEPVKRGIYTGSIGYCGFNGDVDLNIVIRTLVLQGKRGHFQVGAGIVHDSDPTREYEETLHKGEALLQALALTRTSPACRQAGLALSLRERGKR